jgi:transcriptional repressor of dcmA and dcmR
MNDPGELLTIEQAAGFLKVSEASLRRWTNAGRLACLRVGRRRERRFRRADLLAFLEHQPAGEGAAGTPSAERVVAGGDSPSEGMHLCGIYRSDAGRVRLAATFLAEGLRAGSVCFLVAVPVVRKAVLSSLRKGRPSLRRALDERHLVVSEYSASPRVQWKYWETQFPRALKAGAPSLRVVGDMWGMGGVATPEALVEYEAGYGRIARRFGVASLCQYDARRFTSLAILNALKGHGDTFAHPVDRLFG